VSKKCQIVRWYKVQTGARKRTLKTTLTNKIL